MIGIYGGTFDPVHYGHLRPAIDVFCTLDLSEIRFIPTGEPAHRAKPVATAEQRLDMLVLATKHVDGLKVDAREIKRIGPSFMIDTIRSLKMDLPNEMFCLIVGMDAFLDFASWREWETITEQVNIVVTHRPTFNFDVMTLDSKLKNYLVRAKTTQKNDMYNHSAGKCFFCPVTQLDISSTKIRQLVRHNMRLNYLLPDSVEHYLSQNAIYK